MAIKDKNPERTVYTRKGRKGGEETVVRRATKEPKDPNLRAARKIDKEIRKAGKKLTQL